MCHVAPVKPVKSQPWVFSTVTIIALVSLAVSLAATAASYYAQQKAAEAQAKNQKEMVEAQNEVIKKNEALANAAFINDSKQIQNRQAEEGAAAAAKEHGVQIDAEKVKSTAMTAAGEAGVSGLSVNALLSDYTRAEVDYRFQSQTQLENQRKQADAQLAGERIKAEGRIDSEHPYMPKPINYPSALAAGLSVGASATSAAGTYYSQPRSNTGRA
jgi:acetylornithine deacetylase/succinyl-diaminopimelate desuccinylase-like protein